MKSSELKPTKENLMKTFEGDYIRRNADILRFVEIINLQEENSAIAINRQWGSGKTFFVKQTKMVLDSYNAHTLNLPEDEKTKVKAICKSINNEKDLEIEPQVTIYYDAWEHDNDEDPILSLVFAITQGAYSEYKLKTNAGTKEKLLSIVDVVTGRDVKKALEMFSENPLKPLQEKKELHNEINELFEEIIKERGNRLVIFIDELDRCRPLFTIRLLERIKHYFDNENITFVFSTNLFELQHTVKRYYGPDFDASRYLDRFFDFRIQLPKADMSGFYSYIGFKNEGHTVDIVCRNVIEILDMQMREIHRYIKKIRIVTKLLNNPTQYRMLGYYDNSIEFCMLFVIPIMVGLEIVNISGYESFVKGNDPKPLLKLANRIGESGFRSFLECDESYTPHKACS